MCGLPEGIVLSFCIYVSVLEEGGVESCVVLRQTVPSKAMPRGVAGTRVYSIFEVIAEVCMQPLALQPATSAASLVDTHRELPTASAVAAADKSALDAAISSTVEAYSGKLRNLGVSQVAFLCVSPSSDVHRIGFRWSEGGARDPGQDGAASTAAHTLQSQAPSEGGEPSGAASPGAGVAGYAKVPMLSFIEPPTACMLETDTLPTVQRYVPSYAHQLHTFVVQVRLPHSRPSLQTETPPLSSFMHCGYTCLLYTSPSPRD